MELKYKVYDKTTDTMYYSEDDYIVIDFTNKTVWVNDNQIKNATTLPPAGVKDINKKESYLGIY